jgi:hypothetical protein
MNVSELIEHMEAPEFVNKLQLASGSGIFLSILKDDPIYQRLRDLIRRDIFAARQTLSRIKRLADYGFDRRYENPFDVPLAALGLAVSVVPSYGILAADIIRSAQGLWWASKMLEVIDNAERSSSGIAQKTITFAAPGVTTSTSALTSEINQSFTRSLNEINVVSITTVRSSSSFANTAVSPFVADDQAMLWNTKTNAAASEVKVEFAVAA